MERGLWGSCHGVSGQPLGSVRIVVYHVNIMSLKYLISLKSISLWSKPISLLVLGTRARLTNKCDVHQSRAAPSFTYT